MNPLREEFARVRQEALDTVKKAQDENRGLTGEEASANEKRMGRLTEIESVLSAESKFAAMKLAEATAEEQVRDVARNPQDQGRQQFGDRLQKPPTGAEKLDQQRKAIDQFIKTGEGPQELFALVTGAGNGTNGIALPASPPIVLKRLTNPFKAALQAYGLRILQTPSYQNIPVIDDTANTADQIAQDANTENVKDPTVAPMVPGDILYDSGLTWFSNTLLASLDYDLLDYFRPALDARIEEKEVVAWTTAISTGGTFAASVGVTTVSTTGFTYAELVRLKFSIPAARRRDGVFFVSTGAMSALWQLTDNQGRPLYVTSLSDDEPNKLLGWPVFETDTLAAPAANAISMVAASASSLIVREAGPRRLARYQDYPMRPDQVGLRLFQNGGFAAIASGVKLLKHAAS